MYVNSEVIIIFVNITRLKYRYAFCNASNLKSQIFNLILRFILFYNGTIELRSPLSRFLVGYQELKQLNSFRSENEINGLSM